VSAVRAGVWLIRRYAKLALVLRWLLWLPPPHHFPSPRAQVQRKLEAMRPDVRTALLEHESHKRRLRADMEQFLEMKQRCLLLMEEASSIHDKK
jgi:hypothetical protein